MYVFSRHRQWLVAIPWLGRRIHGRASWGMAHCHSGLTKPSSLAFKLNFPLLQHFLHLFLKCPNLKGADVIMMDRWKLTSTPSSQHQPSSGRGVDRFVLVGRWEAWLLCKGRLWTWWTTTSVSVLTPRLLFSSMRPGKRMHHKGKVFEPSHSENNVVQGSKSGEIQQ